MTNPINHVGSATSTRWPTGTEYAEAVQQPSKAFTRPDLTAGQLTLTPLGLPAMASGQNAVAFHFETEQRPVAVRCLLSSNDDGRERYQALARHVEQIDIPAMVPAAWVDEGVRVNGSWWPVVVMPWVDGAPLHSAIEDRLDDPKRLEVISERFLGLVARMQSNRMAHGDLQHGNVLLNEDDRFQLVDLDGIWVPDMGVGAPDEYGHPNYQHHRRDDAAWGPNVDTFSALVIVTSIAGLAADPSLSRFMTGENLLFVKDDFANVGSSEIWRTLQASPDPAVVDLVSRLAILAKDDRLVPIPLMDLLRDETLDLATAIPSAAISERLPTAAPSAAAWWESGTAGDTTANYWGEGEAAPAAVPADSASAPVWGAAPAAAQASSRPAAGRRAPVKATGLAKITGNPVATGVVAGAFAGLFGSVISSILQNAVGDDEFNAGIFVGVLAAMLGGFVAAWPSLNLKAYSAAGTKFAIGAGMGLLAGVVGVLFADLIVERTLDSGQTEHIALVVYLWALVAALIGLAIGSLLSVKAASYAFAGGAVAGAIGGSVHGASTGKFEGRRLAIDAADGGMIVIATIVAMIIGTLVALSIRTARSGSLVVIEGPGSGTTIDFHKRSITIGGARSDTLVMPGLNLPGKAIEMNITDQVAATTSTLPVLLDGMQTSGRFDVHDGQVLAFNGAFVRFELKGQEVAS